jgi:excisionase family DNA binding protein
MGASHQVSEGTVRSRSRDGPPAYFEGDIALCHISVHILAKSTDSAGADERNAERHGQGRVHRGDFILRIHKSRDSIMSTSHAPLTHRNDAPEHIQRQVIDQLPRQQHVLSGPRGLLRVEEAAAWLGLGRTKTYELVGCGALPSVCIGRSRRVPVSALETFIERLAHDGHV